MMRLMETKKEKAGQKQEKQRKIDPTHLALSGLTLQAAESLLRRPYRSLKAHERHTVGFLTRTPEEEAERRRLDCLALDRLLAPLRKRLEIS
jgi:hypothetical protein